MISHSATTGPQRVVLDYFEIVKGENIDSWLTGGVLAGPGGETAIDAWSPMEDGALRVTHHTTGVAPARTTRWEKAQAAEAAFWRTWRENVIYQHVSLDQFWQEVVEKTGGVLPGGKVLDVGCGPVSVLNFIRGEGMEPLGLDPLGSVYAKETLIECRSGWKPMPIIALPAEKLPFIDESLDHLICFNVLDHVSDAPSVLREMRRILKKGGTLRVYVHTFAWWIKKFLFFDRPHTYHWDHLEFSKLLENAGFEILFDLEEPKTFDLPPGVIGKLKHFPYWVATKVAATSYFQLKKL